MVLAIAFDASGNVYITGQSQGKITLRGIPVRTIATGDDYMTIKYDPTGHVLWSSRYYSAQANYSDIATSIVLDASSNVYVTGGANNIGTTVAYSSAGSQLWVAQGSFSQKNTAIAKDAWGNIIVAGYNTAGQGSLRTYYISQYTSAGAIRWTRTYQSGINYNSQNDPLLAVDAQSYLRASRRYDVTFRMAFCQAPHNSFLLVTKPSNILNWTDHSRNSVPLRNDRSIKAGHYLINRKAKNEQIS